MISIDFRCFVGNSATIVPARDGREVMSEESCDLGQSAGREILLRSESPMTELPGPSSCSMVLPPPQTFASHSSIIDSL
jgi:hypothetical protein